MDSERLRGDEDVEKEDGRDDRDAREAERADPGGQERGDLRDEIRDNRDHGEEPSPPLESPHADRGDGGEAGDGGVCKPCGPQEREAVPEPQVRADVVCGGQGLDRPDRRPDREEHEHDDENDDAEWAVPRNRRHGTDRGQNARKSRARSAEPNVRAGFMLVPESGDSNVM